MVRFLKMMGFQLRTILYLVPLLSLCTSLSIRIVLGRPIPKLATLVFILISSTVAWSLMVKIYDLANPEELFMVKAGIKKTVSAGVGAYFITTLPIFAFRLPSETNELVILLSMFLLLIAVMVRLAFRALLTRSKVSLRLLFVGADDFAVRTAEVLRAGTQLDCKLAGFVQLPNQQQSIHASPLLSWNDLDQMAIDHDIDEVIVATGQIHVSQLQTVLTKLEPRCIPIRTVMDMGEGIVAKDTMFSFSGMHFLDLRSSPVESFGYLIVKRVFDFCFSLIALLVTLPMTLIITLLIKTTSIGPIFFSQERVGLNGKVFKMWKFRTMKVSDKDLSDSVWTRPNDTRCTKIGSFLRKTSLDELPQFYNVLIGDMSVVGPRPERPFFVQRFLRDVSDYNARHLLKVGITGWAQVNGLRGDTSIEKRVAFDLYYLKNWSFGFDLQIIVLTLLRGLFHPNAY